MTRYYGAVGYGIPEETAPGVWEDRIIERNLMGDVNRISRQRQEGEPVNGTISVQNEISVVADAFANENFMRIRYINWAGVNWTVSSVTFQSPRLVMRLGVVYNGPTP